MAKAKKERVSLRNEELEAKIDRIVSIRPMANEYRLLISEVKEELLARGADSFIGRSGHAAAIERQTTFAWLLDGLKKCLPRVAFESMCPRKPDAKKLNQRLAATPEDKALAACKVKLSEKVECTVTAKGEERAAGHVDELAEEREAA